MADPNAELERLYRPGLEGVPACRSAIGFIDGTKGILAYRGYRIEELARHSTFEETSYLLLHGNLPSPAEIRRFDEELRRQRALPPHAFEILARLPKNGHPMGALHAAIAVLGMEDPQNWMRLIAVFPTILAAFHRVRTGQNPVPPDPALSHAANFLLMLRGKRPTDREARMLDICLILHAEHTINASTFSARVTGSTEADPYSVIMAAIGTLRGPLHGGANERVIAMFQEIGSPDHVRAYMEQRIATKKKIMGLGHRVYKTKDPRAVILESMAKELFAGTVRNSQLAIAAEVESVAKEKLADKGVYPNVDFYSGIVYAALGIPTDLMTGIFAIARISGWLAHWREQMEDNRLFRPKQIYAGSALRTFTE